MKELDLSVFIEETLDITLPDKRVAHIPKPSERMVIQLSRMKDIEKAPSDVLVSLTAVLAKMILNENKDGIEITDEMMSEMYFDMKAAIVRTYSEWVYELQSNPTLQSQASPKRSRASRKKSPKENS